MDRAFKAGASVSPPTAPASPSVGYPTSGNPGTGTPATRPGDYWFYMITEELRAAIVAAGITPDHLQTTQLREAIKALAIVQSVTAANDPTGADNSIKPASTGWIRNSMLAIATAAGFSASMSANGYVKFPTWLGGLVVQWGANVVAAGSSLNVTLPITFPNSFFTAVAQSNTSGMTASATPVFGIYRASLSLITLQNGYTSSTINIGWIALGK